MKELEVFSNKAGGMAFEETQPEPSQGDDYLCQCPTLGYEQATAADSEIRIHKAFDILFQEVMRIRKSKNPNEINSHIRPGFDRPAGGGTND